MDKLLYLEAFYIKLTQSVCLLCKKTCTVFLECIPNPHLGAFSELFVFVQDEADDVAEKSDLPLGKTQLQELLLSQQRFITEEVTQDLKKTHTQTRTHTNMNRNTDLNRHRRI